MDTKKHQLIESYLDGTLSPSERKQFEQQLNTDPQLKQEVQLQQLLAKSLSNPKIHNLRAVLKTVDKELATTQTKSTTKVLSIKARRWMGVAAGLLLLIVTYQLFWTTSSMTDSELLAEYHQPYKMVLAERSASEIPLLQQAVTAYQDQKYKNAATHFANLAAQDTAVIAYPFYQAIALLSQSKAVEAIPILEKILAQPNHLFIQQSRWYLALAYIGVGNKASAQQQLQAIAPNQYAHDKAQQLLKTLEKH